MPSLTVYRQTAAKQLGPFRTGTATSGSTTSYLECTTAPYKSSLSQDDLYKDYYLMRPNAAATGDVSRVVATYTAASGLFTPDQVYTNSPSGEAFELHPGPVEPYTEMTEMINTILTRCLLITEYTMTPVAAVTRQILPSNVLQPDWVSRVGYLTSTETRDTVDPFDVHPVWGYPSIDVGSVYVNHPGVTFAGTETLYVEVIKQAYYECSPHGGTFGSQSGLSLEDDAAPPPGIWVAAGVAVLAWERYGHLLEQAANAKLIRDQQKAVAWWNLQTSYNFKPPTQRFQKIRSFGPPRYGAGWGAGWSY